MATRTDAHRAADRRYYERNKGKTKLVGVKLTSEEAEAFAAECARRGISQSSVLKAAVQSFLEYNHFWISQMKEGETT